MFLRDFPKDGRNGQGISYHLKNKLNKQDLYTERNERKNSTKHFLV